MSAVENRVETATAGATNVRPVEGQVSYTWKLRLSELHGACRLQWESNTAMRAKQGRVALYKDRFPRDPDSDRVASSWDDQNLDAEGKGDFRTDVPWGQGYCAGYVAEDASGGRHFMIKTPLTRDERS